MILASISITQINFQIFKKFAQYQRDGMGWIAPDVLWTVTYTVHRRAPCRTTAPPQAESTFASSDCPGTATHAHTEWFAAISKRIHRLIQPVPV